MKKKKRPAEMLVRLADSFFCTVNRYTAQRIDLFIAFILK